MQTLHCTDLRLLVVANKERNTHFLSLLLNVGSEYVFEWMEFLLLGTGKDLAVEDASTDKMQKYKSALES